MGKKSKSGSVIRDKHPGSYFREHFFGLLLILQFFDAGPDPESGIFLTLDPEWKNWNPISEVNIPDTQHWFPANLQSNFAFQFLICSCPGLIRSQVRGRQPFLTHLTSGNLLCNRAFSFHWSSHAGSLTSGNLLRSKAFKFLFVLSYRYR